MSQEGMGKRKLYLDVLRVFAILAVIAGHVSEHGFYGVDGPRSTQWTIYSMQDAVVRYGVPVFIMITGALFGDPNREVSIKKLLTKNMLRIVTALAFWYFAYLFASLIVSHDNGFRLIELPHHLWYLTMVICLYFSVPFLRLITASENISKYFIVLSLIFSFLIPQILNFPSLKDSFIVSQINNYFYDTWSYHLGFGFFSYFVIGYWLSQIVLTKQIVKRFALLGGAGFAYTLIMAPMCSYLANEKYYLFYDNMSFNVFAEGAGVFVLVRYLIEQHTISQKVGEVIVKLSSYTFGVYLVHVLVMGLFNKIIDPLRYNSLWMTAVATIAIAIGSFAITAILKCIPLLKKYVV